MPDDSARTRLPEQGLVTLLVNPTARSAGDRASIETAVHILERRYRVQLITPSGIAEIESAAREAAAGTNAVIVAGGDGTIYRIINALEGVSVPIGMLPLGTGNDLARALGVPDDPAGAAGRVLEGRCRRIDLVEVNGRLFCTVGVIGLAADATLLYDRLMRSGSLTRSVMRAIGGWAYRLVGVGLMLRPGSLCERVAIEAAGDAGAVGPRAVHGVFITNGTKLGGGMTLPIESDLADGRLEIAYVDGMSRPRLIWAFSCLANGWRIPAGTLRTISTDRAVITCDRSVSFTADGELVCEGTRFTVAVRPAALTVVC